MFRLVIHARPALLTTLLLAAAGTVTDPSSAQQVSAPAAPPQATDSPRFTLKTSARLVLVDVTVEDSQGRPVHGLKASDFRLEENHQPETLKSFEEHTTNAGSAAAPPMPALPPGSFTNYTPVAEDGTLNVVLLDTLNTPTNNQASVRLQLQEYVKHANPQNRIAIIGLATHLILLQGFTTDPAILKDAIEHRLTPRGSALLDDPAGSNMDQASAADTLSAMGTIASSVTAVQQFESEQASFRTQIRIQYTLDAFSQIARYLANFPGRKNLIWFSGSFPITLFGDMTGVNTFATQADFSQQVRETTSLLDRARVAVYPIDARGLQTTPLFEASRGGAGFATNPGRPAAEISRFSENNAAEHMTMDKLAEDTGGRAFFNTNGLADAVAKAVESGANYYTLSYAPANAVQDGRYRNIAVVLTGALAARGMKLTYRHGYFADDAGSHHSSASLLALPSPTTTGSPGYEQLAMEHGAPAPMEIVFKASVLPAASATEDAIAPRNTPDPAHPMKGPFRRYRIACTALSGDFALPVGSDGLRHGAIEFVTYVYDAQGRLINIAGQSFQLDLSSATYARLMKTGVSAELEVSAPAAGESFFRIAVHDRTSGRFGVIEVPDTVVRRLQLRTEK